MKTVIFLLFMFSSFLAAEIKIPVSFSSNFTQKITSPKKKVIKYSGSILLNNGGALKWSYKTPTKKEVCSAGQEVIVVDHDLEQVSFHMLNKSLDLAKVLKNASHHKGNLYVATYQDRQYTFSLDKKGRLDQIAFRDELDNVVNIRFQNMRYQKKPNSSKKMQCPYPQSYDIIRG